MRSASAFFRPSRRPFGSKAVFGSAPANSWSRMASGIGGSLRLGMVGLLSTHHARLHTKFRIVSRGQQRNHKAGARTHPHQSRPERMTSEPAFHKLLAFVPQ